MGWPRTGRDRLEVQTCVRGAGSPSAGAAPETPAAAAAAAAAAATAACHKVPALPTTTTTSSSSSAAAAALPPTASSSAFAAATAAPSSFLVACWHRCRAFDVAWVHMGWLAQVARINLRRWRCRAPRSLASTAAAAETAASSMALAAAVAALKQTGTSCDQCIRAKAACVSRGGQQ